MNISQENNTKAVQKQIAKKLSRSKMWIVLRTDNEGTHLHTPNVEHMGLLVLLFKSRPELYQMIKDLVEND